MGKELGSVADRREEPKISGSEAVLGWFSHIQSEEISWVSWDCPELKK